MVQQGMVEVGRLERIRRHTHPRNTLHFVYPGYGFDSKKEVAVVEAEVVDCGQLVKTSERPCFPSSYVPSSSPSLTIFSSLPLASLHACL